MERGKSYSFFLAFLLVTAGFFVVVSNQETGEVFASPRDNGRGVQANQLGDEERLRESFSRGDQDLFSEGLEKSPFIPDVTQLPTGYDIYFGTDRPETINLNTLFFRENIVYDVALGLSGNDLLRGTNPSLDPSLPFTGIDILDGGLDNDMVYGFSGDDILYGGVPNGGEAFSGSVRYDDWIEGGDGNDILVGDNYDHSYMIGLANLFEAQHRVETAAWYLPLSGLEGTTEEVNAYLSTIDFYGMRLSVADEKGTMGKALVQGISQANSGAIVLKGEPYSSSLFIDGGNDYLIDHNGDDVAYAGPGNDYILLGAGDDFISPGLGEDLIIYDNDNGDARPVEGFCRQMGIDTIYEFDFSEDRLDLTSLMDGDQGATDCLDMQGSTAYDSSTETIPARLRFVQNVLQVDLDGIQGAHDFRDVIVFENSDVSSQDVSSLVASGTFIIN